VEEEKAIFNCTIVLISTNTTLADVDVDGSREGAGTEICRMFRCSYSEKSEDSPHTSKAQASSSGLDRKPYLLRACELFFWYIAIATRGWATHSYMSSASLADSLAVVHNAGASRSLGRYFGPSRRHDGQVHARQAPSSARTPR
jgi:hypothetical protein